MSRSSRFRRHLGSEGWMKRGGDTDFPKEKRYPGNKAWARFLAHMVASIIVALFKLLESILKIVFSILSSLAKSL